MAASHPTTRRRVLCVDDNPDVLELQKSMLEYSGYEVLLAHNGDDGLNLARGVKVDLAVLDYEMPRMMGTELAQRLRDMRPALPIIILSGSEVPADAAQVADCCLSKTQMGMALVQEIHRLLGQRQSARSKAAR
jgi:CheY-like chemotaxis protein